MKTNVSIETSDEQRAEIARVLKSKTKLASRNDIKEAVLKYVDELSIGVQSSKSEATPVDAPHFGARKITGNIELGTTARKVYNEREFVPSRGDEPYLFRAQDQKLHKLHQDLLNAIDALNKYTWEKIEKNRVHG